MKPVFLLVGVPGSGKSWVCNQLEDRFRVIHHDHFMKGGYVQAIIAAARSGEKPVLAEAPFSIQQTKEPLEQAGLKVTPVFIVEDGETVASRYKTREGRDIPKGHMTRQETYRDRAAAWRAFTGTSEEVLDHLKSLAS